MRGAEANLPRLDDVARELETGLGRLKREARTRSATRTWRPRSAPAGRGAVRPLGRGPWLRATPPRRRRWRPADAAEAATRRRGRRDDSADGGRGGHRRRCATRTPRRRRSCITWPSRRTGWTGTPKPPRRRSTAWPASCAGSTPTASARTEVAPMREDGARPPDRRDHEAEAEHRRRARTGCRELEAAAARRGGTRRGRGRGGSGWPPAAAEPGRGRAARARVDVEARAASPRHDAGAWRRPQADRAALGPTPRPGRWPRPSIAVAAATRGAGSSARDASTPPSACTPRPRRRKVARVRPPATVDDQLGRLMSRGARPGAARHGRRSRTASQPSWTRCRRKAGSRPRWPRRWATISTPRSTPGRSASGPGARSDVAPDWPVGVTPLSPADRRAAAAGRPPGLHRAGRPRRRRPPAGADCRPAPGWCRGRATSGAGTASPFGRRRPGQPRFGWSSRRRLAELEAEIAD